MNDSSIENQSIAIIMPAFNAQESIGNSILSVIKQSYSQWRLYIIDDCSTDNTKAIISNYLFDSRIKLIENDENLGVAGARNVGLLTCQESIISFIDSDDEWLPKKLAIQLKVLAGQAGIIASSYFYVDKGKSLLLAFKKITLTQEQFIRKEFRVCFSSILIKRGNENNILFESIGHEDFLYIYQWISLFKEMTIINQPLVNYHVSTGSLSSDKVKSCQWHYFILKRICKGSHIKTFKYMFFYSINALNLILKKKFAL